MPEKSITRFFPGHEVVESSVAVPRKLEVSRMIEAEDGDWIRWDDHLAALGEAEADRDETIANCERHRDSAREQRLAAEQSLQTLRLSLEAEVDRLRAIQAQSGVAEVTADRLEQLLDQPSETAGES